VDIWFVLFQASLFGDKPDIHRREDRKDTK